MSIPKTDRFYYLAVPYSNYGRGTKGAYKLVNKIAAKFFNEGYFIFSPITHCHPLEREHGLPNDFDFWEKYDKMMIDRSAGVIVCMLKHWERSVGVNEEITYAIEKGKPIYFVDTKGELKDVSA